MSSFSAALRHRSAALSTPLHRLLLLRSMGGGPRTFAGGLNKWQYKRMHEKLAREKERKLLNQEKQIYQARLRSEIRAKIACPSSSPATATAAAAMTSKDHIKALADRFMKENAEDLWNEDDGPVRAPAPPPRPPPKPLNLRKLVSDGRNLARDRVDPCSFDQRRGYSMVAESLGGVLQTKFQVSVEGRKTDIGKLVSDGRNLVRDRVDLCLFDQRRCYSVVAGRGRGAGVQMRRWRKNSSSEDEDSDSETAAAESLGGVLRKKLQGGYDGMKKDLRFSRFDSFGKEEKKKESRFPRFTIGNDESEEELDRGGGGSERRKMMSGAALRNYDVKTERRVPRPVEVEDDLSKQIKEIRNEAKKREFGNNSRWRDAKEDSILTQKRFDEYGISPRTIEALDSAGYAQMTVVQEAALPVCLEGKDALVKARTGTGKSVAFLLPAIEAVLMGTTSKMNIRGSPISVLILCPTRELAIQIAAEANVLLKHHEGIGVQTLIGGTRFKVDQKRLESDPCQIIVATPGRLLDHIENKSGFSIRLMGLKLLILDEADHLLDLGFRKDIEKVVDCVPRQRQSLLFSATIPKEVRRISQLVLKKEHAFVDTVGLGGLETPAKILQSYHVAPHELHFNIIHHLLKEHIKQEPDYKVMVFCTTAMVAAFTFVLLRDLKMNVREMHSRKPQLYRTRISDEFRESKHMILVTSDVSARGMNYPDVTMVIQVGIPPDREQYIHRIGRTGREGKGGEGILLLAPWEEYFMDDIRDLPIEKSQLPEIDPDIKQKVEESIGKVDTSIKEAAYHAWLGYYNSISQIGRDKTTLAELATRFCYSIGLERPPALFRKTALKMGLKDIPGIRIRK